MCENAMYLYLNYSTCTVLEGIFKHVLDPSQAGGQVSDSHGVISIGRKDIQHCWEGVPPDRCRLTDKHFETVMMIKCNDRSNMK